MSRNQRLTPFQPVYQTRKMLGGSSAGNTGSGYALAAGGIIITNTPTLVEHSFNIVGTSGFILLNAGTLDVAYSIVVGSFAGFTVSGTMSVTSNEIAVVGTPPIVVSYDPSTDWTPA